jgi:alkanesulfonate monooxygenase SsuD/methylene tetrahydromethanopterin reductase-like flavin-dependent oxidoreductase (luciferase family)
MRLGVSLDIHGVKTAAGRSYTGAMRTVERVGFDGLWFFDTIGRGMYWVDPVSAMSAAAAVTEHVELGTCILQVPLRHPVELAHRVLAAHYLSGGRVRLGVGAGSTEADFTATGNDFKARFRKLEAALPVMRGLWRGETVDGVNLKPPQPVRGGPPILIGSWAGSRWIPIAAQQYDGWIASAHFTDIATLKEGYKRFKGKGGGRTIAANIPVDLTAESRALTDDDNLDLRCGPEEARVRLEMLAETGFDDAVVTVSDFSEEHLAAVRALFTRSPHI